MRFGHLPSIDNLQCFLAAAEHLNFRRASEEVALTPTAFGQRIKQLEEGLGEALFHRTTRTVELSAAGQQLVPVARRVVREARRCVEAVHEDEPPARFTLGTRFELGMSWLVPALTELRQARPTWHVNLFTGSGSEILERLRSGQVDCVVSSAPVAEQGWTADFLHPEEYVFVGEPGLLARQPLDEPKDAVHHTVLDTVASLPLTRYLTSAAPGITFGEVWLCGAGAAMRTLVRSGHGVAVLPRYMVADDLVAGRLVELLPELELLRDSFRLLYRRDAPLATVFEDLAAFLRERPLT